MADEVTETVRVLAGRYQLGELLGRGGMAEVYAGTDARLGRRVAVKLLRPSLANDPSFRTRFRQEAQAAARMAHPTIVRVFDAGEETVRDASGVEIQVPFIVMERVDGTLLKDLIEKGPVAPTEAVRIIDGVLTALEYSHRAGVVHRDIKPGNIMVASNGQVKVMDFGIARAISESSATIAQTSAILGTAQYFSPEQARGEAVDARTDLYSTGVVLYELLTGAPPFTADSAVAVAYQHVSEEPVPPSTVNAAISPALNAVVLRSMSKDRFGRYQTAAEFRSDVDIAGEGKVPDRLPNREDEFNATLFGVNPAVGGTSAAALRRLAQDDDGRAPRSTQSRPPVAWIWGGVTVMVVVLIAVMVWVFSLSSNSTFSPDGSVAIPKLAGSTYTQGSAQLTKLGLHAQEVQRSSSSVTAGTIIRTTPGVGQTVSKGFVVTLEVSSGPRTVSVPSLTGMTQDAATAALKSAGLKVGAVSSVDSGNVPLGQVVSSSPVTGSSDVRAGSSVDLQLSSGNVSVPDVRGQQYTDAVTALSSVGPGITAQLKADTGCTGGAVTTQSASGEQPQGATIVLTYCSGS